LVSRRDIEIDAEGVTLRGWFYRAEGAGGPSPTIVMAHGLSAVKEMYLDRYAEVFAAAGLNSVVYDNRNFGASDGEPRQEIDPWAQVRDYRNAITYAITLDDVDSDNIGVWGSSYSGGHVLVVAAIDRRVQAVVSQGSLIDGYRSVRRLVRPDFMQATRDGFDADRLARFNGAAPTMIPVVDPDPMAGSVLPTPDSYKWFTEAHETVAPSWRNEITLRSLEMISEYIPASYIQHISPTPLLLMPPINDVVAPTDLALEAFEEAREPKQLVILPGGHFDIYIDGFDESSSLARDWFVKYLVN
jgi:uncharacterized protein